MRNSALSLFFASQLILPALATQPDQPSGTPAVVHAIENFAIHSHDVTMAPSLGSLICPHETDSGVANQLFQQYLRPNSNRMESFWSATRCQDLMADRPPPWFELFNARFPRRVNGGIPQFIRTNWAPVCSMSMLKNIQLSRPQNSPEDTLDEFAAKIHETDGCSTTNIESRSTHLSTPQDLINNQAPRRIASDHVPMRSEKERSDIMALAPAIQGRARDLCCAESQTECLRFFDSIEVTWCDLTNPNSPNRCNEGGAELTPVSSVQWARNWQRLQAAGQNPDALLRQRDQIEYPNFRITLDPRTHRADGSALPGFRNHGNILSHEMGHACSTIQRALAAKNGTGQGRQSDLHALQHYVQYYRTGSGGNGGSCNIEDNFGAEIYTNLFNRFMTSGSAVSCLVNSIHSYPRNRFQPHWGRRNESRESPVRRHCQEPCAVMHLEESFADSFSMLLASGPEDFAQWTDYRCTSQRDTAHPASVDLFRCLAAAPEFRQRMQRASGCQP